MAEWPGMWLSAWMRPWAMLGDWNALWRNWGDSWRDWLKSVAAMPAAWMPALAAERQEGPESIAFFLPWLPRVEARVEPLDPIDGRAMRVMLRATLPAGLGGERLEVDAVVRRSHGDALAVEETPAVALPASGSVAAADKGAARTRKTG